MRLDRDMAEWVKLARSLGWTVEHTTKNHLRFKAPDGKMAHIGGHAANEGRAYANAKAQLRRAGLVFPEDEERSKAVEGIRGIIHEVDPLDEAPAILRADAPITDNEREWYAQQHPEDCTTTEELLEEVHYRMDKEHVSTGTVEVSFDEVEEMPSNGTPDKDQRAMLIKIGRMAGRLEQELSPAQVAAIRELLTQAGLCNLSMEDLLEALPEKPDTLPVDLPRSRLESAARG